MFLGEIDEMLGDFDEILGIAEEELDGLGAPRGRFTNNTKVQNARNRAKQKAQRAKQNVGMLANRNAPAWAVAQAMIGQLSPEIQKGIAEKRLQLVDKTIFSAKQIAGKTFDKLITSSTEKKDGYSNIDKGKLNVGEPFLLTGISLLYGVVTSANTGKVETSTYQTNYEAAVMNGYINMTVANEIIIHELPLSSFNEKNTSEPFHFQKLEVPKWIQPEKQIELELFMPSAASNSEDNLAVVKVILHGAQVIKR
ncbi:MAG: hypothetical protein SNJ71_00285 [Bacteroidales bacterium]